MSGAPKEINPGTAPLLWSNIEKAFRSINQNFNEIYATIQADGSTEVVNFERLFSDVSPGITESYSLGSSTHRWDKLHVGEWNDSIAGYEDNGVWLGTAQIKGISGTIDLPANSTVDGDLIFDPEKRYFRYINLDDGDTVEADHTNDTLSFYSGNGMQFIAGSDADSITFENTGVLSNIAGAGISVSSATGNITITNTGVLSISNGSTLPTGLPEGSGLSTTSATGNITLTNTGVIDVDAGFGITISRDNATGIVTVTNSAPAQVAFRTFYVSGTNIVTDSIIADSTSDLLTLEEGYGITLTTTPATDTLKIEVNQDIDIYGSVFAQDSSLMVDSIDNKLYATSFEGISVKVSLVDGPDAGPLQIKTGDVSETGNTILINPYGSDTYLNMQSETYFFNTGPYASSGNPYVKFTTAGAFEAIDGAFFKGDLNGSVYGDDSTALVDGVSGKIVGEVDNSSVTTTSLFTALIDTVDSSAITIVPAVNFNTDVTVENDLTVQQDLNVNGKINGYISIADLQVIASTSADFTAFKAAIAAL